MASRRYFRIGGFVFQIEADLPITERTFHNKFSVFEVPGPSSGDELVRVRHSFDMPKVSLSDMGKEVYRKLPWAIYRGSTNWTYGFYSPFPPMPEDYFEKLYMFNDEHTDGRVYHRSADDFIKGGLEALVFKPTDQILIGQLLSRRGGCYLHGSGFVLGDNGILCIGRSGAGKTTLANFMKEKAEILCDDRIILRPREKGFTVYGTWHHGDLPDISPRSAPLRVIYLLRQASQNRIEPVQNRSDILAALLACVIRPFADECWWNSTLPVIERIAAQVPIFNLYFNQDGAVSALLQETIAGVGIN